MQVAGRFTMVGYARADHDLSCPQQVPVLVRTAALLISSLSVSVDMDLGFCWRLRLVWRLAEYPISNIEYLVSNSLHFHLIVQANLISRLAAEAPVVLGCFSDGDFQIR